MALEFYGDIYQTQTFLDGCNRPSANEVVVVNNSDQIKRYSLDTLQQNGSTLSTTSSIATVTMASTNRAVVAASSGSTVQMIDLSTDAITNLTSANAVPVSGKGQQSAGNLNNSIAMICSSTSGNLMKVDVSGSGSLSILNPASLSGTTARSVIVKDSNWIMGTANGKVVEIDSSGATIQSITLPTTPNSGSAPSQVVTGLTYDSISDRLCATTSAGILYVYDYGSSTLLNKIWVGIAGSANKGTIMCDSASGVALICPNGVTHPNAVQTVSEFHFATQPVVADTFFNAYSVDIVAGGINSNLNRAWIAFGTSVLRVLNITPQDNIAVETRIQNSGADVAGRIIRLRRYRKGCYIVESDQNVSSGAVNIGSKRGETYIEVAINSDSGEVADIRSFNT